MLVPPILTYADPQPWMKMENSNELAVIASADDDCPLSKRALTEIAESVLAKSNINLVVAYEHALSEVSSNVFLLVTLNCLPERPPDWLAIPGEQEPAPFTPPGENFVVLAVDFGGLTFYSPSKSAWVRFGWDPASGFMGKGSGDTLGNLVKTRIERAVEDYIEANSQLWEEE